MDGKYKLSILPKTWPSFNSVCALWRRREGDRSQGTQLLNHLLVVLEERHDVFSWLPYTPSPLHDESPHELVLAPILRNRVVQPVLECLHVPLHHTDFVPQVESLGSRLRLQILGVEHQFDLEDVQLVRQESVLVLHLRNGLVKSGYLLVFALDDLLKLLGLLQLDSKNVVEQVLTFTYFPSLVYLVLQPQDFLAVGLDLVRVLVSDLLYHLGHP